MPKKPKTMKLKHVFVTPEMAKRWLAKGRKNKPINVKTVKIYEALMEAGKFNLIPGISDCMNILVFDESGRLLNGYHRLHACILAGVGFWAWVTRVSKREWRWSRTQGRHPRKAVRVSL